MVIRFGICSTAPFRVIIVTLSSNVALINIFHIYGKLFHFKVIFPLAKKRGKIYAILKQKSRIMLMKGTFGFYHTQVNQVNHSEPS